MEWDTTTVALVVSSIVTLFGIIPQIVQSLSYSKSDRKRVENEAQNASAQGMAQFAGAAQVMQGASASLINELQEEAHTLRDRNSALRDRAENAEGKRLSEHLHGKQLLSDLILLREKHSEEFSKKGNCTFGKVLDKRLENIIKKYEPIFANGLVDDLGKPDGYEEPPIQDGGIPTDQAGGVG